MTDDILTQIDSNGGKKVLDIDDVVSYNNGYGEIVFSDIDESDGIVAKKVDTLTGIGYKTSDVTTGEIFNSYPTEEKDDYLSSTSTNYSENNNINKALTNYSHARNLGTIVNDHQAESSLGQFNISNDYGSWEQTTSLSDWGPTVTTLSDTYYGTATTTNALLIIGDGIDCDKRHNLLTIRSDCTGYNKAGSLSFSGDVDIDGHLAVTDYVYSPIMYTDTLCYTNGDIYELTGEEETFKLFDDDDETSLEVAKTNALEWVESSDDNKAFYRDPESQEIYQIPLEDTDENIPVATVETVDLNALNMSITNNLYLSSGATTITTDDGTTYAYDDYSIAKAVQAPVLISGVFSDEFMDKYTIDYDTALKLAAIFNSSLDASNSFYYTTQDETTSLAYQTIYISDEYKKEGDISSNQQLSSFIYDTINDLDNNDLENYNFIFSIRKNVISSYNQAVLIPVNKNTKKISISRIWSQVLKISSGNNASDYFCPDVDSDSEYINDSEILRTQLIGSWWSSDLSTHNTIKEVFPEYLVYLYSSSIVPTKDISQKNKWNSWYKSVQIQDCFPASDISILEKYGFDGTTSLYDFVHTAAVSYLGDGTIINTSNSSESWDLGNIVLAEDVKEWVDGSEDYLSYNSSSKRYTVSDSEGLSSFVYGDSPIICASTGLESTRAILQTPFVTSCSFSFSYMADSLSNLFKTYPATFIEKNIELSSSTKSYYFSNITTGEEQNYEVTELSDPIEYIDTSNTRYVSQINTGINKVTSLSFSDETGSAVLDILGSEGSIDTDQISWEDLIDSLNQNKVIDVLGSDLIRLKAALSSVDDGTYCITSVDGQVGLSDFTDSGWKSAELSAGNSNTGFGDISIYYRTIGNLLYIKGSFTLKSGYSEGDYDSLILSPQIGEDAVMLSGIGMNIQSSTGDNLYTPCAVSAYNNGVTYLIFYFLNTASSGTSISFSLSGTIN